MQAFTTFAAKNRRSRGFTLVETVVALGIVAFAMLGILGMIPLGLSNFREAMSNTAESQIVQSISNDILLTSYSQVLSTYRDQTNTFYYSDDGRVLAGSDDPAKVFEVTVDSVDLISPLSSDGQSDAEAQGQTVRIEVRRLGPSQGCKKYSFIVPKS